MTSVLIKICGLTDPGEVEALDALGAEFLGFNFHPQSPRYVEPAQAARLTASCRRCEPVGVFVDQPLERLEEIASTAGLRWIQLHGSESWDYASRCSLPVIKALTAEDLDRLPATLPPNVRYLLVDSRDGNRFGGTGKTANWEALRKRTLPVPFFLAGGLGPHNLKQALDTCSPHGIDLNSKVENAPGRKNIALIRECLALAGRLSDGNPQ